MDVSENSGTQIIHFNRVFHYKPSILGYPYFWKHPCVCDWLYFVFWKLTSCFKSWFLFVHKRDGWNYAQTYLTLGKRSQSSTQKCRRFVGDIISSLEGSSWFQLLVKLDHETPRIRVKIPKNTPSKFNIAPENLPSQRESSLPIIIFQGLC